ncbi:MAG: hypothetical protein U5K99_07385 [Anaerolineales bacterium]|nr:hypothetical protein [Anaerolineales bacterium]MDZ7844605.1 hypothetical protein [Anaerolineales bacterium]
MMKKSAVQCEVQGFIHQLRRKIRVLIRKTRPPYLPVFSERGRSLPAALIALAVGSILLAPFLSFVSSRSLGSRAAAETFRAQYAADAGIEYGIWILLNDPVIRAQVDSSPGTPLSVTFPEAINGVTPTVTLTANPLGQWFVRQPTSPDYAGPGGALEFTGGNNVYALMGNGSNTFKRYNPVSDSWIDIITIPWLFYWNSNAGDMTFAGGNSLYTFFPGYFWLHPFYRYSTTTNSWYPLVDTPEQILPGAALVFAGGNDLYALRGGGRTFWHYDIGSNSWEDKKDLRGNTSAGQGAALVYTGGNYIYALLGGNSNDFFRFDMTSGKKGKWESLANAPGPVSGGGSLAYYSGDYIYALQGGSRGFWRYTISSDTWAVLADTPEVVGSGGDLAFVNSSTGYALRGGGSSDFWEFSVTPPRYDITSQAGSTEIHARIELDGVNQSIVFWDIE